MRFENNLSTTSGLDTSALTRRRAAMSWALAVVMRRSTHRRSSLARASVVVMRPLSSSDVHRLRMSALRASVSRLKRLPPEVPQSEQLLFLLLEQLADGLDLVRLQAVERPH